MKRASVAQLKDGLSSYLREAQNGKEIVVTNRGECIAKIGPFVEGEENLGFELTERQRQMVREGCLILPKKRWDPGAFHKLPMTRISHNFPNPIVEEREEGF